MRLQHVLPCLLGHPPIFKTRSPSRSTMRRAGRAGASSAAGWGRAKTSTARLPARTRPRHEVWPVRFRCLLLEDHHRVRSGVGRRWRPPRPCCWRGWLGSQSPPPLELLQVLLFLLLTSNFFDFFKGLHLNMPRTKRRDLAS